MCKFAAGLKKKYLRLYENNPNANFKGPKKFNLRIFSFFYMLPAITKTHCAQFKTIYKTLWWFNGGISWFKKKTGRPRKLKADKNLKNKNCLNIIFFELP